MSEQQIPSRLVFRVPQVSILAALLVAICATPMAIAEPILALLYLIPAAVIVWVIRVRTVADAAGLTVRSLTGSTTLPWDDLKGMLLNKGKVTAVRADDSKVDLPSVRTRHLPALSLISGGRISDPTEQAADPQPADSPTNQVVKTNQSVKTSQVVKTEDVVETEEVVGTEQVVKTNQVVGRPTDLAVKTNEIVGGDEAGRASE